MEEENKETQTNEEPETEKGSKNSNAMLIAGIALAVLVLVAGFAFAQRSSNTNTQNSVLSQSELVEDSITEENTEESASEDVSESIVEDETEDNFGNPEMNIVEIEGGAYYFKPNEITVKKGETVKIVFANAGGMHDFVIDDLDVKTPVIQSGNTAEVEFSTDKVGEYEYYCSVGNHRQMGMVGTLTVTN